MRYKIIEFNDNSSSVIKSHTETGIMFIGKGRVQSEEETLAKFKEIYSAGVTTGVLLDENRRHHYEQIEWNRFKATL